MNHFHYSALTTFLTTFFLGVFVYSKKREYVNKVFCLYSLSISFWSFFVFLHSAYVNVNLAWYFGRFLHLGAIMIPVTFFHFTLALSGDVRRSQYVILKIGYVIACLLTMLNFFTSKLISGVSYFDEYSFPTPGDLYGVFFLYFITFVFFSLVVLYRLKLAGKNDRQRVQASIVFYASLFGYLGGMDNFLITIDVRLPVLYPYGAYAISIYVAMVAFSIVKHKFLDIEVIIKRTLVFTGIVAAAVCLVAIPIGVVQAILGRVIGVSPFVLMVSGIIATALVYRPLEKWLVNLTDRYLFQKRYDYKVLLKEASQEMATIKSLQKLAKVVVAFLIRKARISRVVLFVYSDKVEGYGMAACRPFYRGDFKFLRGTHPIVDWLSRIKKPVSKEELKSYAQKDSDPQKAEVFEQVIALMAEFKADVVIPSFLYMEDGRKNAAGHQALLRCLLFLGPKKSDEEYSQEDLDVFFTIAQESAIAVENARLYDEAVNRSYELEEMNEELQAMNKRLQVTQASLIVAEKSATMVGMAKAIGHEVNNPLSAVIYRSQAIEKDGVGKLQEWAKKNDGALSDADREFLNKILANMKDHAGRIKRSGDRIAVVVKTLTNIMKEAKGEMGPLSLTVLCREAIEATRFSTYEENLSSCEIKESISANIIIYGNLEQLIQVFVNLIKNAYEAMLNQKERRIEIRGGVDPRVPGMARIEVADNGPGIPPETLPKIWQQGFSTKKKMDDSIGAAGQGQGLFICKHMIESVHKGILTVESAAGKGTTFIMKLPLAEIGRDA